VSEVTITGLSEKEFQAVDASTGLSKEDEFRIQIANDLGVEETDVIISKITVTGGARRRLSAASLEVAFIVLQEEAENASEIQQKVAALEIAVVGASVSTPGEPKIEVAKSKAAVEAKLKAAKEEVLRANAALADAKEKYITAKKEALLLTPGGETKVLRSGLIYLARSGKNQLLRITKTVVSPTERTALAGRSYGARSWESASSSRATELLFSCGTASDGMVFATAAANYTAGDEVCSTTIPAITDGHFHIEVYDYSMETVDAGDLASRFLQTATFGSSKDDISAFQTTFGGKPEAWVAAQMNLPATSHREFFRRRANRRMPTTLRSDDSWSEKTEVDRFNPGTLKTDGAGHIHAAASPLAACTPGSRWHKFAFTKADIDTAFVAKSASTVTHSSDSTVFTSMGAGGECCSARKVYWTSSAELGKYMLRPNAIGTSASAGVAWDWGTITSEKGCEAECAANADCKYFNYEPTRKLCIYCKACEYKQYDAMACKQRIERADGTWRCSRSPLNDNAPLMSNGGRGVLNAYTSDEYMKWTTWKKEAGSAVAQEKVTLAINNHLRTTFFDDAGYLQNVSKPYRICSVEEKVGGVVRFGADCSGYIPNPAIALDSFPKDSLVVKTTHLEDTLFDTVNNGVRLPDVKILGAGDSTFTC